MTAQTSSSNPVTIHLVGDVGPRRIEYGEEPESLFAMVHQKVKEADIAFCQLERNFSTGGCLQYRRDNTWYGRVRPENVKSLVFGGFNVVSHASNRCFNYGPESLLETIDVLRSNNMQAVGVGKDIAEARNPAILERKGIKVGFLAYCSVLPAESEAREEKPGCAPMRISTYYESNDYAPGMPPRTITIPLEEDVLAMEDDIRKLRKRADVAIVSVHWGMHHMPGAIAMYQPKVGRLAIDAGADLVVGHHDHIIKGIEVYKGRAIFYGLGNFAQETPWHEKPPKGMRSERTQAKYRKWKDEPGWQRYSGSPDQRYSMMVKCTVNKRGVQKVSFLPVWINQRAEPEVVSRSDSRFEEVLHYVDPWCKELGTALTIEGDEVVVCGPNSRKR
ncbi:MAG: CapA family protein [Chloroflexi bacterium]|nr:CapA family protein [Chloroflexota bacterium]